MDRKKSLAKGIDFGIGWYLHLYHVTRYSFGNRYNMEVQEITATTIKQRVIDAITKAVEEGRRQGKKYIPFPLLHYQDDRKKEEQFKSFRSNWAGRVAFDWIESSPHSTMLLREYPGDREEGCTLHANRRVIVIDGKKNRVEDTERKQDPEKKKEIERKIRELRENGETTQPKQIEQPKRSNRTIIR